MTYSIPYSFIPGTKARAQEVNANFKYVLDSVDEVSNNKLNTSLSNITNDAMDLIKNSVGSSRNIGEIVISTIPLTDANLHLLDGELIYGNGSYKDFVDYMVDLYEADENPPDFFTDETTWQNSVSNYGVCAKFVYNSANNTIRLPKITGFIEGTTDLTALGDLVDAGLPNITGSFGPVNAVSVTPSASGVFSKSTYNVPDYSGGTTTAATISMDASTGNSIYGNSSTVQPQSVKLLYYIVISTSPKTNIQIDYDNIYSDLSGKAGTDLSNINACQSAKNTIVSWGMPDYANAISLTAFPFTAPCDGILNIRSNTNTYYINGINIRNCSASYSVYNEVFLLNKNDVITASNNSGWYSGYPNLFVPMKGVN